MRASQNDELMKAWATVPDVAKAQERHEAAVKLRRDFPRRNTPVEALAAVRDAAIARFNDTGKWPTDFAKDAAKAHADALVYEAEALALRLLEDQTKNVAENLRDVLSVDVLTHLDGRLKEILDAAKSAGATLGDVTTAEQAIEAGGDVLDAWRRLTALLKDFGNVRDAQWSVLRAVAGEDERARIRQWTAAGHGEVQGLRMDDIPAHIAGVMRSHAYSIEYLVWLARSGAGYVPTSVDALADNVTASTEPLSYDDHGPLRDFSPRVTPIPVPPAPVPTGAERTPELSY
ncbi:hypothetical protein [Streptomyces sp. NPDC047869]|uniref:hypothetical protein n=1 Tax=Streptomyces sp. NPDC047869 TaxID=3154709 RepID=UPI00345287F8